MAITKIKLKQLENSVTAPGSIPATDASNILTYVTPSSGVNHLWGFETGGAGTLPVLIGTNLSYDAPSNTLNASAGAGGYSEVQEESGALIARSKLAFIGTGLTAADDAGNSRTTVTLDTFLNTLATAGTILLSSGNVSGTLPVGSGGTGATTLTGALIGNGTGAVTAVTSSTTDQILKVTGANTYSWGTLNLASTNAVAGVLDEANGGTGNSSYAVGDILYASTTSVLSKLADVATGNALISGGIGVAPSYGKIGLTTHVSGILPIANGGTGSSSQNFVDLSTTQASIGGNKTFTGNTTFSSNVTISSTPSANDHAATVGWVLNNVAGLKSGSVRGATIATLTITGRTATTLTVGGTALTLDGVTYANDEFILVKNNTTGAGGGTHDNGVYKVSGVGTSILLTRADWMNTAGEIDGVYVLVQDGTTMAGTLWFTVSDVTTLGTDAISFTQIQTSGTIGGSITDNQIAFGAATANTIEGLSTFNFDGTKMGLGTASPSASSRMHIKGTGTSLLTYGLLITDSADAERFRVQDDGTVTINNASNAVNIWSGNMSFSAAAAIQGNGVGATGTIIRNLSGGIQVSPASSSTTTASSFLTVSSGSAAVLNSTSNNQGTMQLTGTFSPNGAGTNTFKGLEIVHTISQTTHTGITRGIHILPTLTAAADYRGLEITATGHFAIKTTAGKIQFDLGSDAQGDLLVRGSGGNLERLAAHATAGYVLTSNGSGAAPTYQAAASATAVTRVYKTSFTGTVITLNSGTDVTDKAGSNVAFSTSGLSADQIFVVKNGVLLSESGTPTRDYTINTTSSVLTLAETAASDDQFLIYKIV